VPPLTYSISGFVNGDTKAVIEGAPVLSTIATSSSTPGNYAITVSQGTLAAGRYTFKFVPGTLTVSPWSNWLRNSRSPSSCKVRPGSRTYLTVLCFANREVANLVASHFKTLHVANSRSDIT
jgi:hypothetical protein